MISSSARGVKWDKEGEDEGGEWLTRVGEGCVEE